MKRLKINRLEYTAQQSINNKCRTDNTPNYLDLHSKHARHLLGEVSDKMSQDTRRGTNETGLPFFALSFRCDESSQDLPSTYQNQR